jgi:uncharacterized repeat protein (TIGR03803 family)
MPDGSGYIKLLDFNGAANGGQPFDGIVSDGIFLYGTTYSGGINGVGTVFKIKPDGTNYLKLIDFAGAVNGSNPSGTLFFDGTFLYGVTTSGGVNNLGAIFKVKTDGSGFTKLFDFGGIINGEGPNSSFFSDGTFLYGMTQIGGEYNSGIIYKIKSDGTSFDTLMSFNGVNGGAPNSTFAFDGTFLYGTTRVGGINGYGNIFKIKPNGTGFDTLINFDGVNGNYPDASLMYDGIFLYGTTVSGGINGYGNVFKIKPDGSSFTDMYDFNITDGSYPHSVLSTDGTFLYGITSSGGSGTCGGYGTIFKIDKNTTTGIEQNINSNGGVSVYPNPVNSILNVVLRQAQDDNAEIQITDILGQEVRIENFAQSTNKTSIDVGKLHSGVYFITVKTAEGIETKKIIKN